MSYAADPVALTRLCEGADGIAWAAARIRPWQHERRAADEWTPHQHVFHLLANEVAVHHVRIPRILAEERPAFANWDEAADMRQRYSTEQDILELAAAFVTARNVTHSLLQRLDAGQWARTGVWPDGRRVDLSFVAERATAHAFEHLAVLLQLHGAFSPRQALRG